MNELDKVLDKHIKNIEQKFKRIPKSTKHQGMLAEIQNKLESSTIFAEKGEKIVNQELDAMLKYINTNLVSDLPQEEVDAFIKRAKNKITEALQKGINDSLN